MIPRGFKHSEKSKLKMSETHKKKTVWNKGKKGMQQAWNKGIKMSVEAVENNRNAHLGQKSWNKGLKTGPLTFEVRKKMSESQRAKKDKLWNWKGGSTLPKSIRSSFRYRQWISDVFTRDDFICQFCGKRGGQLNADHIKPFSHILQDNNIKSLEEAMFCEELWNINNGRTLCVPCHKTTDTFCGKSIRSNL